MTGVQTCALPIFPNGFAQHDLVQGVDPAVGAVADMDGDGAPDIVVADRFGGSPSLYWIRNLGVGNASSFTPADIHPVRVDGKTYTASHVLAVRCADLDRDGRMDLVLIHGTPQAELLALVQKPDGTFRQLTIDPDVTPGNALAVGDVNRDRIPDIAAGNGPVKLYLSKGAPPHWSPVELAGNEGRTGVVDLRLADMNGDKRPDLLVLFKGPDGQTPTSLAGVWMNTAGPWQYIPILEEDARDPSGGEAGGGLAVADVDQDGDLDIVRAHRDFPLAFYENVWNTQRLFRVTATAQQPGFTQRVTTYVSTHPNGTPARPIGQSATSQ